MGPLSCSRDGLYGLADLTCWPALIGRPVHRSVDARRSGDERRHSPSSPYMNSTISANRRVFASTFVTPHGGWTVAKRRSQELLLYVSNRATVHL